MKKEKCEEKCNCNEECNCGSECNCTHDEKCSENCTCDEKCHCGDECHCGDDCKCDSDCDCEDECSCEKQCECEKEKKPKKFGKKDKINELEVLLAQARNDLLLSKAELINYRKRKDEEVIKMLQYSNEDLVKELLPIIDTFERAINMDDDNLDDEVSKFLAGFKMMYCNMIGVLEKYGVKAIDGNNKVFDPTYHQAVMTEKREDVEPGMVLEVLQKGYLLKDKVIRHAMVRVSE